MIVYETMICSNPFRRAMIAQDGSVTFCCRPGNIAGSIGNIFDTPFEEIWHGEKAREIRRLLLAGDYSPCNTNLCTMRYDYAKHQTWTETPPPPEVVNLAPSNECNQRCVMCRRFFKRDSEKDLERLYKNTDNFISMLKNAQTVVMNHIGEPLFGRHCEHLFKVISEKYPNIKFSLHTNGQFLTEERLTELGIADRISEILISVHAASRETYEKLCVGASWDRMIAALEFTARMKKDGRIKSLITHFVLSSINYRELPDFVEMSLKYGAEPKIWGYKNWGVQDEFEEREFKVFERDHPEYLDFVATLNQVAEKYPTIYIQDMLKTVSKPGKIFKARTADI